LQSFGIENGVIDLRQKVYDDFATVDDHRKNPPKEVDPEQWKWLVNYWDSEKFRVRWRTLFYYSFSMHLNIKFFVMCFFLSYMIAVL